MIYADEEKIGFQWFLAVAWFAVVQFIDPDFFAIAFQPPADDWWGWGKSWFFRIIGLVLVGQAIWNQVSKRRFGKTTLSLESSPAYVGETLSAQLTIPRIPAEFPEPIAVMAQCVEIHHRDKRVNTEKFLWKHEASADLQKGEGAWKASLSVALPKTKPPTRARRSGSDSSYSVRWQLIVHIPMKGMDFKRTYPVTVVAREE